MVLSESGDRWTATLEGGVIIFEFLPGMDLSRLRTVPDRVRH